MSDSVSSADLMPPPQTNVPLAKAMLLTAMAGVAWAGASEGNMGMKPAP